MTQDNPKAVEPFGVAQEVDRFIDEQFANAAKFSNSEVLDGSGAYTLHQLAGRIYQMGWGDGHLVGMDTAHKSARRAADRKEARAHEG